MKQEQLVVVGAGIAGISAALHAAKRGREVTLVDPRINPYEPIQTATRATIPFAHTSTIDLLGLSSSRYPEIIYRQRENGLLVPIIGEPATRVRGVDALSVRRTLLEKADENQHITLVEGKAVDLVVEEVSKGKSVTGVVLHNKKVIETGVNGMVVVATGTKKNILHDSNFVTVDVPTPSGLRVLGGYITSPTLSAFLPDTERGGEINGRTIFVGPSEQIKPGGTNYATFIYVNQDSLNSARGGIPNALGVMQDLTRDTFFEDYFTEATLDRVLLYTQQQNVMRIPIVNNAILVGDARRYIDPTNGSGFYRIVEDSQLLEECLFTYDALPKAAEVYNSNLPVATILIEK
jgi:flavin-dependent dehydrogenase